MSTDSYHTMHIKLLRKCRKLSGALLLLSCCIHYTRVFFVCERFCVYIGVSEVCERVHVGACACVKGGPEGKAADENDCCNNFSESWCG